MPADVALIGLALCVLGAIGALAFLLLGLLFWDPRLARRQNPGHDAGIEIFDDRLDATEAQVHAFFDALAATPARPLSPAAPPARWEQPMIAPTPKRFEHGWRTPPERPKPRRAGPTTLQFVAIAKAETKVEPELGPDEPTWATWEAMELPVLGEKP